MCINPEDDLFIKPNLALLDETNNLKDSNLGQTLLVDAIGNIFIDDKYSKASDLKIVDLPETKKKNKNTKKKNPNPEELMNEMSKMLDMMENLGNMANMSNLGNMANMSNLGNMKLPPITNPQFGNFPAFDISHAFNEHLLSDNPFTILSSMRPQQKQKVAQVDKIKPEKIIEKPLHVTSNKEPLQVTSEKLLQVTSNKEPLQVTSEESLQVQSNEVPLHISSNEEPSHVTSNEEPLHISSNEEPSHVTSNEGSLQVQLNEKSLGDVANEELTSEQLNSFDNIMSELSAIAEKAENISNSKIMLKKKTGKHKKKKSINNK
jgi:hypothetical protein